jgi:hypothetical protein
MQRRSGLNSRLTCERNPLPSGPATGSLNGLNPKSKFLAFIKPKKEND